MYLKGNPLMEHGYGIRKTSISTHSAIALILCSFLICLSAFVVESQAAGFFADAPSTMPNGKYRFTATVLPDGKILIAGGRNAAQVFNTADIFDPSNGTFSPLANTMNSPRCSHTATPFGKGKVLISGGVTDLNDTALTTAEIFDSSTGTFSPATGSMNGWHSLHSATLLQDGKVLIAGGSKQPGTFTSTEVAELFDPASETFALTSGSLNVARGMHTATLLNDGTVLLAGGFRPDTWALGSAEIYDPATKTFSYTNNNMGNGDVCYWRAASSAVRLDNGKVLISGGYNGNHCSPEGYLYTAELYDPGTKTFNNTGSLPYRAVLHSSTLFSNGLVLVAGIETNANSERAAVYNPDSGTFYEVTQMPANHGDVPPALLPDDNVLLCGGTDSNDKVNVYKPVLLTVSKTGGGTVTSSDAGINCGPDCSENYYYIQDVTLTAFPNTDWIFTGWTGDADCPDGVVAMDADKSCTATFSGIPCSPVPLGLISWWKGENNAFDAVAANNGTLMNGAGFAPGRVGQAFSLDGVDDYVQTPNVPSLNPASAITVEAWYRTVSFAGDGNNAIVSKGYTSHSEPYYQYHLGVEGDQYPGPNPASFSFTVSPNGQRVTVETTNTAWIPGNWYHLVGTYDGAHVNLYVNGAVQASTAATGALTDFGKSVQIGAFNNISRAIDYTPGLIDEAKLYNRALSANEIAAIYNAGSAGVCPIPEPPLPLSQGWNFISFPKVPPAEMATVFSEVSANVAIVWAYDNQNQRWMKWKPQGGGMNTLPPLEMGKGYWVYMNTPGNITMGGWAHTSLTRVTLSEGWNLVGYLGPNDGSANTALNTMADKWESMWGWTGGTWYGKHVMLPLPATIPPLSLLNQGRAYWIKIKPGAGPVDWVQ